MNVNEIQRNRTYKVVVVTGIGNETNDQIADFAMAAAAETRHSLFDWRVVRPASEDRAIVRLYTD